MTLPATPLPPLPMENSICFLQIIFESFPKIVLIISHPTMQTFQHHPVHLMISFVVTAFMTFVIGKFYGIHEESMEPIIMLKIHHLTEATLLTFCNLFLRSYGIEKVFLESGAKIYCIVTNFLNYYTTLCMLCSCTILHYEVYQYNLSRSNRLDLQAVKDRIFSSKGILFLVTVVGFSLDKPAQKCQNNENPEFNMIINKLKSLKVAKWSKDEWRMMKAELRINEA